MEQLLLELARLNISLEVRQGNLGVYDPNDNLAEEHISAIRQNKGQIVALLEEVQNEYDFKSIPKAEPQPYYKLSSAQKRMYFLYALEKESTAYNMPQVFYFGQHLSIEKLTRAFRQLIARHEILRTTFHLIDGEPVQKVSSKANFEITYYRVQPEELEDVKNLFTRPFNLRKGPLLRVGVVELPSKDRYMLFDIHHIISDGVSYGIMMDDLMALYQGNSLEPQALQYKDYAEWQQGDEQQAEMLRQKDFWLQIFEDQPEHLELPTDFSRPAATTYAGNYLEFFIDKEETQQLKQLAQREGATMFILILSLYHLLLSKLCNQSDIVIGTPVAGRQHAEVEKILGLFVNTLPLRNQVKAEDRFIDFLDRVKKRVLACFDNQSFQYEELIEALKVERSTNRNPLFDVLFAYDNFADDDPDELEESNDWVAHNERPKVAKFDLSLSATEENDGLLLCLEYSTDLFEAETIKRYAAYFRKIITAVTRNPNCLVSEMELVSAEERRSLLFDLNHTKLDLPHHQTVLDFFEAQASRVPNNIALFFDNQQLTYRSLDERANQLAHYLLEQSDSPKVIGLLIDKSIEMIVGLLGILKANAAYLPLDGRQPVERSRALLEEAGASLLLTEAKYAPRYEDQLPTVLVRETAIHSKALTKPSIRPTKDDIAYIIYTSGSTGKPKGVEVPHRGVSNLIAAQTRTFGIEESERIFQFSSVVFDASVEQIWLALANGAGLVLAEKNAMLDSRHFNDCLDRFGVSHLDVTPSFLESTNLDYHKTLQRIVIGGEACKPESLLKFARHYKIYNAYGPTEASVTSVMCELTEKLLKAQQNPIGRPLANTRVYLLDDNLQLCPRGVVGELHIGGIGLAVGYLGDEKRTRERFIADPFRKGERLYKTGDLARWRTDGQLEFLGRKDKQVKLRGFRIELGEIESRLSAYPKIGESAVVLKEYGGEKFLVAYYVHKKEIPSVKLSEYLRDCLPPYMLPSYFVRLDRLPLSSSDKLNERALPDPTFETTDNYLAPSSQLEYQLVSIWSKVLNIEADKISVDRSFFEMGGHSLRAIQLVSAIREELRFELPLVDIFKYPTIKAQAGRIPDGQDKRLQNNEILTLLRRTDRGRDNLFFVHDGSGDIQAYMELVTGLEDFSCWGLRSPSLSRLGPQQPSLPEMARCYIDQIKGVQSEGPYTLLGWSLGGNIVFEMARQLEASGELVRQIVMIDTPFPFRDQTSSVAVEQSFNLQTEKLFISQFLGVDVSIFSPKESIAGLWQKALHLFGEQELNLEAVKAKIPQEIRFMIPHFDSLTIAQLAASVNTIRTLETAVASYNTVAKVDVPLLYIKASQSDLNLNGLPGHFRQKAIIEELQGDHFSILQAPVVDELQAIIHQRMGLALITT